MDSGEEINCRRFHVKEGGVYLLHGPMFEGVFQSEQTFLKSSFWQAVSNSIDEQHDFAA